MTEANTPPQPLRRGWTTGACATAALTAALRALREGAAPSEVTITLPRGERPTFVIADAAAARGWSRAAVVKDAGDDPDVTHGVTVVVTVEPGGCGLRFAAGDGVGTVTKPGLPVAVGEPAINPVPRQMMTDAVHQVFPDGFDGLITVSIPGGAAIAAKTWNPRLGITGGLSILGTTGIVRPFSCAAWIASIHRGIDVARAAGETHVAGCTGATSERVVQTHLKLPDHAMLDMGDFAGGVLKYLRRHPVERLTLGGGFGKLTKLAQGALDLHSARSQVDFTALAGWAEPEASGTVAAANTAMEALQHAPELAAVVSRRARDFAQSMVPETAVDVIVVSRDGTIVGTAT